MKVYIASSFSLSGLVQLIAEQLMEAGHEITVNWWDRRFHIPGEGLVHTQELKRRYNDYTPDEFYSRPECKFAYETDFEGVKQADALLFVAEQYPRAYNGANVELGMALALGKPCYSIGRLQNSAMYWPVKRLKGLSQFLEEVQG